jgi:hypothetical protein
MIFILKNHQFFDQFNRHSNYNKIVNTPMDDIQLKKKYEKSQAFNQEDCYNLSENSDEEELNQDDIESENNDRQDNQSELMYGRSKRSEAYLPSGVFVGKKTPIQEKISYYKMIIKYLDIFTVVFIIIGAILSQYEQEIYYRHNIITRVTGVVMVDYMFRHTNHTFKEIFSSQNVNMTDLVSFEYSYTQEELMSFEAANPTVPKNDLGNYYLLSKVNLSLFRYEDNMTDYNTVFFPLEISDSSNSVRVIILITTIASCCLIFFSRYVEHQRDYVYKKEIDLPFYKGVYFILTCLEIALILPVQYPEINGYIVIIQLGSTLCLPYTSIFSAISVFRFVFIYKIFKNFTVWSSEYAESRCEKNVCSADTLFAFKALQKENPFFTLLVIFVLTCVCFGFSLRIFEMHYWETQENLIQNWRYHWNAMWCVFVSMTTVGYGDFFPKTHFGRVIVIIACVVGIYFVSMMMVFMTQKSILSEAELKAYKLITRLKLRKESKDLQARIIYHSLKMAALRRKKAKNQMTDNREFDIAYNYEHRCIISLIDDKKVNERNLKNFEFIPDKEQLFDVCERIEADINEIKQEIDALKNINQCIINYSQSQSDMIKYLRKNIYSLKLTYAIIDRKPQIFGNLAHYDRSLMDDNYNSQYNINRTINSKSNTIADVFNQTIVNDDNESKVKSRNQSVYSPKPDYNEEEKELIVLKTGNDEGSDPNTRRRMTNPNQFDEIIPTNPKLMANNVVVDDNEDYSAELANYNVTPDEIKTHFNFLFFNQADPTSNKKVMKRNTIKTLINIKNMKKSQNNLKKRLFRKATSIKNTLLQLK